MQVIKQKNHETIQTLVINNFEELKQLQAGVAEVEGDTYHWFYDFLDSDLVRIKIKHLFTKQTEDSLLDWEISYQEQSSVHVHSWYQFSKSSLFFIDQVAYLKIYERIYNDFEDRARAFLKNFQQLKLLRSDFAPAYYNEACMFAILGNAELVLKSLKRAFELNKSYKAKALRDPDLKSVRELPEFRNLVDE